MMLFVSLLKLEIDHKMPYNAFSCLYLHMNNERDIELLIYKYKLKSIYIYDVMNVYYIKHKWLSVSINKLTSCC